MRLVQKLNSGVWSSVAHYSFTFGFVDQILWTQGPRPIRRLLLALVNSNAEKGSSPYFQREIATNVLRGLIYHICEQYVDDVLIDGPDEATYVSNAASYRPWRVKYK